MKIKFGQKTMLSKLGCFLLFFLFLSSCYKTKVILPSGILVVKNGEQINAAKNSGEYNIAMENISKILGQTLILRKIEKTNQREIANSFSTSANGYLMKYDGITTMTILRDGGYTEDIQFTKIYIIRKIDIHYIYFVVETEQQITPYIPFSETPRLPRN